MKLSSLKDHDSSNGHRYAASTFRARVDRQTLAPMPQAVNRQMRQNMPQLKVLFNTAHTIAKLSRPFTDFGIQLQLQEKNGVVLGNSYRTDRKCQEFVHAIAEQERMNLSHQLETAPVRFAELCANRKINSGEQIGMRAISQSNLHGLDNIAIATDCTWRLKDVCDKHDHALTNLWAVL